MKEKSVSLVLGSGGARGIVHIGVIRWLKEHNYKIKSISGCSMGALVGGFYAAGKLDIYTEWLLELDTIGMLKLLDFKGSGGLVSGQKLMNKMQELVGNPLIEDLPITFTAVASDSKEEKEVWINKGPLLSAIRASISMPLFFTPYFCDGEYLIDGGILNPVPIAPTFHDRTDLTIAVNLGGAVDRELGIVTPQKPETTTAKIKEFFSELALPQSLSAQTGMYQIATQTIDAMQGTIARMKLAAYPPDVEIEIPWNLCATLEFNRAKELIDYGYAICDKYLEK